ncbi:hypothetical protein [Dokdonella soli]|uniref:DUF4340 domain-containing protein n=1 Tax=Dokdonella soli TaxID=529810 RepID=A0ABN1IG60_9GAMM
MKRRTRTLVFLLAAVALLGAAVFAEIRREQTLAFDPLTTIDLAAVRSLAVTCNACKPRRFDKVDGHWQMREPFARAADDAAVDRLAAIAHAPVRFRHAAGELEASKLGLDPPQATLTLDGTTLKFGTTDAIHGDRYVEVGGLIALVPDRFSARLFAAPENELAKPK